MLMFGPCIMVWFSFWLNIYLDSGADITIKSLNTSYIHTQVSEYKKLMDHGSSALSGKTTKVLNNLETV
jgi:hypothetical protein